MKGALDWELLVTLYGTKRPPSSGLVRRPSGAQPSSPATTAYAEAAAIADDVEATIGNTGQFAGAQGRGRKGCFRGLEPSGCSGVDCRSPGRQSSRKCRDGSIGGAVSAARSGPTRTRQRGD